MLAGLLLVLTFIADGLTLQAIEARIGLQGVVESRLEFR